MGRVMGQPAAPTQALGLLPAQASQAPHGPHLGAPGLAQPTCPPVPKGRPAGAPTRPCSGMGDAVRFREWLQVGSGWEDRGRGLGFF